MNNLQTWEKIVKTYPDQWVLLGNPVIIDDQIQSGIVLCHSTDKKAVLKAAGLEIEKYEMVKILFTGEFPKAIRFNIFKVTETNYCPA